MPIHVHEAVTVDAFKAVSVNTEIHQIPQKYTEIHHNASIYLPKYTHTTINQSVLF